MSDYLNIIATLDDASLRIERVCAAERVASAAAAVNRACYTETVVQFTADVATALAELQALVAEETVRSLQASAARADARHQGEQRSLLADQGKLAAVAKQAPEYRKLVLSAHKIKCRLTQAYVLYVLNGGRENANDTVTDRECPADKWASIFHGTCCSILCDMTFGQTPAALAWFRARGIVG